MSEGAKSEKWVPAGLTPLALFLIDVRGEASDAKSAQ